MLYLSTKAEDKSLELQKALTAVDGYLFLGMPDEATQELDDLELIEQKDSDALRARVRILLHLKQWRNAEELSEVGNDLYPNEDEFMVQRAFALHQMRKGNEAIQVLLSAPEWIRRTGILHYNLACYEARLGDLRTAKQCIRAAIEINSSFKKNVKSDPDLQAL